MSDRLTLPFAFDAEGRLTGGSRGATSASQVGHSGRRSGSSLAERMRLVLEVVPGERPLLPEFGCAVQHMKQISTPRERQVAAALIEDALERWLPSVRVVGVDMVDGGADRLVSSVRANVEPDAEYVEIERLRL